MTGRYRFLEDVFDDNNSIEDEYIHYRSVIEYKLNNWEIPYLSWWIIFFQRKLTIDWINYETDKDVLPYVLDLIWKLVEERKVKVESVEIYERDDKKEWEWYVETKWYLDPCEIEDEEDLKKKIEEWKKEVKEQYNELLEKFWESSASSLFDLIEVLRADCYEWEIRID